METVKQIQELTSVTTADNSDYLVLEQEEGTKKITKSNFLKEVNSSIDDLNTNFDRIYPVGSIYMSVNSTNPSNLFGGTWSQITDRFLIAAGSSYTAGGTGGSSTVTLSSSNLPSHTHSIPSHTHSIPALSGTAASAGSHNHAIRYSSNLLAAGSDRARFYTNGDSTSTGIIESAGAHTHTVTTTASTTGSYSGTSGSTGSGSSFSIIPPYMAVYMWQRTA